ncbi:unnamed protein product, partial [Urochloa humidicola]
SLPTEYLVGHSTDAFIPAPEHDGRRPPGSRVVPAMEATLPLPLTPGAHPADAAPRSHPVLTLVPSPATAVMTAMAMPPPTLLYKASTRMSSSLPPTGPQGSILSGTDASASPLAPTTLPPHLALPQPPEMSLSTRRSRLAGCGRRRWD